jgi:hypothetical protein
LDDSNLRNDIAESGFRLVDNHCSWEAVSRQFEKVLLETAGKLRQQQRILS